MADSDTGTSGSGSAKLRFDDIVARVNADPAKPGATLLSGFIGKGTAEGRVRIYTDLGFGSWREFAEADVVHSVPFPGESSPLGGSYVWVKSGANIEPGPAAQAQAAPYTVYPQITCGFVCHTQEDCAAAGATPLTVPPQICTETMVPTRYVTCPPHICTETIPPTRHVPCPPLTVPPHICTETMAPTRFVTCLCAGAEQAAAVAYAPNASTHGCVVTGQACPNTHSGPTCPICVAPTHAGHSCIVCYPPPWTIPYSAVGCPPPITRNYCPQQQFGAQGAFAARAVGAQVPTVLCHPTQSGNTCPNGDCTFFGCPTQHGNTCPRGDCTFFNCHTQHGSTCPNGDCTFFGCPPTRTGRTCPVQICDPVGGLQAGGAQAGAFRPTPTATFYHTCGIACQVQGGVGVPFSVQQSCGIACTYVPACPVPTPNCTLPSVTCPYTPARTGIFNPLGG